MAIAQSRKRLTADEQIERQRHISQQQCYLSELRSALPDIPNALAIPRERAYRILSPDETWLSARVLVESCRSLIDSGDVVDIVRQKKPQMHDTITDDHLVKYPAFLKQAFKNRDMSNEVRHRIDGIENFHDGSSDFESGSMRTCPARGTAY